jgi:AraC family transcriptional regulator
MDDKVTVSRYASDKRETFTQTLPQQMVAMILKPTAMAMGESAQRMRTVRYGTQDLALCAAHSEKWVRWLAPMEMLMVTLPEPMLLSAAYEMNRPGGTNLAGTPQFADLRILHLMKALDAESEFGFRSGRLYLDSVLQALAVLLLQLRSTMPRLFRPHRGGLAPTKLKRVLEYIDSNLDREISLTDLAEAAGLSAAHLCNAFRHSTGKSPHQFVMHARIERAKELFRRPGLRVIDVAIASGFKNPQHFARVFRSACHLTPTQYKMEYGFKDFNGNQPPSLREQKGSPRPFFTKS